MVRGDRALPLHATRRAGRDRQCSAGDARQGPVATLHGQVSPGCRKLTSAHADWQLSSYDVVKHRCGQCCPVVALVLMPRCAWCTVGLRQTTKSGRHRQSTELAALSRARPQQRRYRSDPLERCLVNCFVEASAAKLTTHTSVPNARRRIHIDTATRRTGMCSADSILLHKSEDVGTLSRQVHGFLTADRFALGPHRLLACGRACAAAFPAQAC